jgi:hypothetical protein
MQNMDQWVLRDYGSGRFSGYLVNIYLVMYYPVSLWFRSLRYFVKVQNAERQNVEIQIADIRT